MLLNATGTIKFEMPVGYPSGNVPRYLGSSSGERSGLEVRFGSHQCTGNS